MPHVNIKHFPTELSESDIQQINEVITTLISERFHVDEKYISIALEPIEQKNWEQEVMVPEIQAKEHLLCKKPNY